MGHGFVCLAVLLRIHYVRNYKDRLFSKRTFKCLFVQPILFTERQPGGLNTVIVERANEGHGEHRASREADHGAHWGRDAVELDPNRIDGVVIAGGRGA